MRYRLSFTNIAHCLRWISISKVHKKSICCHSLHIVLFRFLHLILCSWIKNINVVRPSIEASSQDLFTVPKKLSNLPSRRFCIHIDHFDDIASFRNFREWIFFILGTSKFQEMFSAVFASLSWFFDRKYDLCTLLYRYDNWVHFQTSEKAGFCPYGSFRWPIFSRKIVENQYLLLFCVPYSYWFSA